MAQVTATFETGTNAATIATSDTGSANAFDVVMINSPATVTYDTTHVYGALAAKIITGAGGSGYVQWSSASLGAITDAYGRLYLWTASNPNSVNSLCLFRSTGTARCRLGLNTAGKLEVRDSTNTVQATSTNAIALSQWNRIEFHVTFNSTVGFMEIKLFQSADSSTATETLTSASNLNFGGGSSNEILMGWVASQNPTRTMWLDNLVWGAASYPGPASSSNALVNTVAPSISGSMVVGSTVTASPGTWTPTPSSFTYFWHRADDNIGTNLVEIASATGSTYTLDSADTNKYIQVGVIPVP